MPVKWVRSVSSVNVDSVGWGDEGLLVTWRQGTTSLYAGVPEETARSVVQSPDIGPAINEMIKPNYVHRRL